MRFFRFVVVKFEVGEGTKKTIGGGTKKNLEAKLSTAPLEIETSSEYSYLI